MGLLTGKEDDLNAGLALEKMMSKFEIDIDDEVENIEEEETERINRRREKIKKERE